MFDLPVPSTTGVLPSSCGDQAIELLWQKLASTEAEARKLSMLLADGDSLMTYADIHCSSDRSFPPGSAVLESVSDGKVNTLSPILANVPETDASHGTLVSRVCHMESAVSSFRATIARISHERDYWRREKLSSDERCTREADALTKEITRLRTDAEGKCRKAVEANQKLDKSNEQLRNDLAQSVHSLVRVSPI